MLKITTETQQVAQQEAKEVQFVELPAPIQPVRKIRADLYLSQQKALIARLQTQLDEAQAVVDDLEGQGIKEAVLPVRPGILNKPV